MRETDSSRDNTNLREYCKRYCQFDHRRAIVGVRDTIRWATNTLFNIIWRELPQASKLCRDKHNFVATSMLLSRHIFVATNSCRDKTHVLSQQKTYLSRQTHVFVATKLILVAAPASDISKSVTENDSSGLFYREYQMNDVA